MEYTKPWLSLEQQVELLENRGVEVGDGDDAAALLKAIGYYRLTGYLYPFKESEQYVDEDGRTRTRVLSPYRPGTTLQQVAAVIDFDRRLRMLVMGGVERIEVAVRMRVGYVLGRASAFAHEDPATFTGAFTTTGSDPVSGQPYPARMLAGCNELGSGEPTPTSSSSHISGRSTTVGCRSGRSPRSLSWVRSRSSTED